MEYYIKNIDTGISTKVSHDVLKENLDRLHRQHKELHLTDVELYNYIDKVLEIPDLNSLKISCTGINYQEETIAKLSGIKTLVKLEFTTLNSSYTSIPEAIYKLIQLKILHINNIDVESLSEAIGDLLMLEELWVYNTKLQYLPKNISKLTKLTHLGVEANDIRELPDTLSKLSELQTLDVFFNSLTSLPTSLSTLTKLEKLDALYNEDLVEIPKELLHSNTLKKFMY